MESLNIKMEKMIELKCASCDKKFNRALKEQKRNLKKGRKAYCSRVCSAKDNANLTILSKESRQKGVETLRLKRYLHPDLLAVFKPYLRLIRRRVNIIKAGGKRGLHVGTYQNITLEYLQELWDKQNGICPYSGIKLTHMNQTDINNAIFTASIDRIDSSKGYLQGNIQFVSMSINYMKGQMSHEQTLFLCTLIAKNYNNIC